MSWLDHYRWFIMLMRHKLHVFRWSLRLGVPVRGLLHDLDKFRWRVWIGNVRYRFRGRRWDDVYVQYASLAHLHRKDHHWQWWATWPLEGMKQQAFAMHDGARREMLADWLATSQIKGRSPIQEWYARWRGEIMLHPSTRRWVEETMLRLTQEE